MSKIYPITLFAICLFSTQLHAQVQLNGDIGLSGLPGDSDSICSYVIPSNPDMTFMSGDIGVGDTVPDFTLYDVNDNAFNMASFLALGKPVLLISINYTCPYVRNKVPTYNDIVATYGSALSVIGIYQLEAHPVNDYSPNSGNFGNVGANTAAGIIYDQHMTYGDRKAVAIDYLDSMNMNVPMYLDGPCNEWWAAFGPGPAMGYLINPDGTVFSKHGWFDKAPDHDIYCDIDSLLGNPCSGGLASNGVFSFALLSTDTIYGTAGTTITAEGEFENLTASATQITLDRVDNLPSGWSSAICVDICLSPSTDTYTFLLPPNSVQSYHMYFYTDGTPNIGEVDMTFTNDNDSTNAITQTFICKSSTVTGFEENFNQSLTIFPNPVDAGNNLYFSNATSGLFQLMAIDGSVIFRATLNSREFIELPNAISPGIYFYTLDQHITGKLLVR
ncbi:MAG: redoxin domain-containing protein [Flavobacteriales bacterium]|nr:redoxin domain-containing protein [Flavobacteriales bacterium]